MTDTIETQFEVLDERFRSVKGDKRIERLHAGCRWTEGPAYFPAGRFPPDVFSDSDLMLATMELSSDTASNSCVPPVGSRNVRDEKGCPCSRCSSAQTNGSTCVL